MLMVLIVFMFLSVGCTHEQVLYWLSGLTCTDENFITKSGAQRAASKEGIALIAPDTSPSQLERLSFCPFVYHFLFFKHRSDIWVHSS